MAAVKRKAVIAPQQPRKFADGETVLIKRPHLWSGCVGEVVGFANGLHRVKITGKPEGTSFSHFHADVAADLLETYL